jgi:ATP-dependent DNA helicase RecQ
MATIYRTGQKFGAGHIIDVLTGKTTEKTTRFAHEKLPVFAAGKDTDARTWQSVLRQLTAAGLVLVDHGGHGALVLGEGARAVFRHERIVTLRKDRPKKAEDVRRSLQRAVDLPPAEARLFDALRAERSRLARQQGVPPYVIFHDTTLRAMAVTRPATRAQMIDLPGLGKTKLDHYGEAFLAVIAAEGS